MEGACREGGNGEARRDRRGRPAVPPVWWPALLAGLALVVGLVALAATPGADPGAVRIYEASQRPSPIPADPAASGWSI